MKKNVLFVLILVVSLAACCQSCAAAKPPRRLKGSGEIITRSIPLEKFDGVDASRGVEVVLTKEKMIQIRIEADDNVMEWVRVGVNRYGDLDVRMDREIRSISNCNVTVTVPALSSIDHLEASSGALIRSDVALRSDDFKIDVSSGAAIYTAVKSDDIQIESSSGSKVKVAIQGGDCTIDTSSAGKVILSGRCDNLEVSTSSGSSVVAKELEAQNATVDSSSGSSARVNVVENMSAQASSGASIRYTGENRGQSHITKSSGGSVKRY